MSGESEGRQKFRRGAWAEHVAILWLLANGYDVYKNVCSHGPIDMIATKGDEVLRLDVKTQADAVRTPMALTDEQIALGIQLLSVTKDGLVKIHDPVPPSRGFREYKKLKAEIVSAEILREANKHFKTR